MRTLIALNRESHNENLVRYVARTSFVKDGKVALVTVLEPNEDEQIRMDAFDELMRLTSFLPKDVQVQLFVKQGKPLVEVGLLADEWGAKLLVIGSQPSPSFKLFGESFTRKIQKTSKIPVWCLCI